MLILTLFADKKTGKAVSAIPLTLHLPELLNVLEFPNAACMT